MIKDENQDLIDSALRRNAILFPFRMTFHKILSVLIVAFHNSYLEVSVLPLLITIPLSLFSTQMYWGLVVHFDHELYLQQFTKSQTPHDNGTDMSPGI